MSINFVYASRKPLDAEINGLPSNYRWIYNHLLQLKWGFIFVSKIVFFPFYLTLSWFTGLILLNYVLVCSFMYERSRRR